MSNIYNIGGLIFKPELRLIKQSVGENVEIKLSEAESKIFELLITNSERFFSKDELLKIGWDNRPISHNSLPVAIANLRKTINDSDVKIENMPKKGYAVFLKKELVILNDKSDIQGEKDDDGIIGYTAKPKTNVLDDKASLHHSINSDAIDFFREEGKVKKTLHTKIIYSVSILLLFYIYLLILKDWSFIECDSTVENVTVCYQKNTPPPQSAYENRTEKYVVLYSKNETIQLKVGENE